jgi:hypothetical protein
MIAPIRPQPPSSPRMLGARRVVSELLLQDRPRSKESREVLSRRATWLLLGWAVVVAFTYLIRGRS